MEIVWVLLHYWLVIFIIAQKQILLLYRRENMKLNRNLVYLLLLNIIIIDMKIYIFIIYLWFWLTKYSVIICFIESDLFFSPITFDWVTLFKLCSWLSKDNINKCTNNAWLVFPLNYLPILLLLIECILNNLNWNFLTLNVGAII